MNFLPSNYICSMRICIINHSIFPIGNLHWKVYFYCVFILKKIQQLISLRRMQDFRFIASANYFSYFSFFNVIYLCYVLFNMARNIWKCQFYRFSTWVNHFLKKGENIFTNALRNNNSEVWVRYLNMSIKFAANLSHWADFGLAFHQTPH